MREIADANRQFVKTAMAAPYLEREEERQLAIAWRERRDEAALHRLTLAHMRLVIAVAGRFRNYGLSMPDLIQEGNIGLMEAAARFESERDVRFSTYATWWIRASMQDHVLRNWSIVRGGTSSSQKALFFNLRRLRAQLARNGEERMSPASHAKVAAAIGVKVSDVALMDARLSGPDMSLNMPMSEDGSSAERMDFIPDDSPLQDETVGDDIDRNRRLAWLRSALGVLSAREMKILQERRLNDEAQTLEALGGDLGISKERVRQIETRALEKLKAALLERHHNAAMMLA
jgi:RNA polymerase sigma-32 factor